MAFSFHFDIQAAAAAAASSSYFFLLKKNCHIASDSRKQT